MIWPTLRNQVLIVCKAFFSGGCVATNISVGGNYDDSHIDWSICQSLDHIWAMQLIWACCILRRHCKLAPVGNKVLQCSQCTTRRNDLASHPALRSEGEKLKFQGCILQTEMVQAEGTKLGRASQEHGEWHGFPHRRSCHGKQGISWPHYVVLSWSRSRRRLLMGHRLSHRSVADAHQKVPLQSVCLSRFKNATCWLSEYFTKYLNALEDSLTVNWL
jgi:hypothetical protein